MNNISYLKKIIITALCSSLCVVLPIAFHVFPNAGSIFCPIHIPVFLCGLICGSLFGGLCGVIGPLLSSFLTGMPPLVILPSMIIEVSTYGVIAGLMINIVKTKKLYVDLYASLISAMLVGKIFGGIATALLVSTDGYTFTAWATSYFIVALPAIIIQLTLIPAVYASLSKSGVIPYRYKKIEVVK